MTDEQAKYRAEQIVHVRARIFINGPDHDGEVCMIVGKRGRLIYVTPADIVSCGQPPLKVGDWVHIGKDQEGLAPTRIVAIDDDTAWLRDGQGNSWAWLCDAYGNRSAHPLSDLVRA